MELTPIRTRGRRKRNRTSENLQDVSLKNRPRPWKAARFNHASLQVLTSKKVRRDPNLSHIEQLPTELLQVIFESCDNINLPLSSFVLAQTLSHRTIYIRVALDLLSSQLSPEVSKDEKDAGTVTMSRMLQCKWMTWDIFKASVLELHKQQVKAYESNEDRDEDDEDEDEDGETGPPPPDFNSPNLQLDIPYLNLGHKVQLPMKVLQGPWSSAKVYFLNYLVWHGASIDWTHSSRGEVATAGLDQAIQDHNHTAVALLCSPSVGVIPDLATLRSATMDHGCDLTTLFYMFNAAIRAHIIARTEGSPAPDVNFKDPSLWSWAERVNRAGNDKGKWLLDALRFAGDASRGSVYDEQLFFEFRRACGREEDGVVGVVVPITGTPGS